MARAAKGSWPVGRKVESEVLPVTLNFLPELWPDLRRSVLRRNGGGNVDLIRLYARLVVGIDQLWLAIYTRACRVVPYAGVIVTSITSRPPAKGFAPVRSLTVHLVSGSSIESWIDSAVERIGEYGKAQDCRQVFLLARKGWRRYAMRFFGVFEETAYSWDRPTRRGGRRLRARPGHFRRVKVAPEGMDKRNRYRPAMVTYVKR